MWLPCCGHRSRVGGMCLMLGSLGLGASAKGCLGRVHGWCVQAMLHGMCPAHREKPEVAQGLAWWLDGWAGHAPCTHPTQQPGTGGPQGPCPGQRWLVQATELVLCKKINHCLLKQLKPGVEQVRECPTLPVRCPWWGVGHKAPLQPRTMTLSWAGFAGQQDTGSHAWSPACCRAAGYQSRNPFKTLLRADEPWWARGRVVHLSHGVLDHVVCSRVYTVAACSSPCM